MGREYVRGFRKAGARVIATDLAWEPTGASSDHERFLEEVGNSPDVLAEYMDITIDSHVKRVFTKSVDRFGTIDVIVNNAGMRQRDLYPPHGSVTTLETEVGDWQRMFDTHVFGALRVIKTFVAPMLAHGRGSIVSVSSGGYATHPGAGRHSPASPPGGSRARRPARPLPRRTGRPGRDRAGHQRPPVERGARLRQHGSMGVPAGPRASELLKRGCHGERRNVHDHRDGPHRTQRTGHQPLARLLYGRSGPGAGAARRIPPGSGQISL